MELIEYNNTNQAVALLARLNKKVERHYKGCTNAWTFIKEHPTQSKVGVVMDRTAPHWGGNPNRVNTGRIEQYY